MDKHYLAGFFDGEGSISLIKNKEKSGKVGFQLVIHLSNTNLKILEKYKELFGGSIYITKRLTERHKQAYYWTARSKTALMFLEKIKPYLFIKKRQAILGIEFSKQLRPHGGNRKKPLTKDENSFRIKSANTMKELNGSYKWSTFNL